MKVTHYIYFANSEREQASKLSDRYIGEGYAAHVEYLDYNDGQWAVIVNIEVSGMEESGEVEDIIISLADEFGGEYDGSETHVS